LPSESLVNSNPPVPPGVAAETPFKYKDPLSVVGVSSNIELPPLFIVTALVDVTAIRITEPAAWSDM
jgi:hypothetical protein